MELISDIVKKIVKNNKGYSGIEFDQKLHDCWQKLGPMFKDEVDILSFKNGILTFGGNNNVLLFHLNQLKKELIEGFNREMKTNVIKDIRTRIVKLPDKKQKSSPYEKEADAWREYRSDFVFPKKILAKIDNILADIENKDLQNKMRSFYKNTYILESYEQTK